MSNLEAVFDATVAHLKKKLPEIKISNRGQGLNIDGVIYSSKHKNIEEVCRLIPEASRGQVTSDIKLVQRFVDRYEGLFSHLMDLARDYRDGPKEVVIPDDYDFMGRAGYPVGDLKILTIADTRKVYIFNEKTKAYFVADKMAVNAELQMLFGKQIMDFYRASRLCIDTIYAPDKPELLYNEAGHNYFNIYKQPDWAATQGFGDIHPVLSQFFKHLIPNDDCRANLFNWIANTLFLHRHPIPILVLLGHAGIGKNTLVEKILLPMVGESNLHKAASVQERFNSSIKNCVLHFSDEGEVLGIVKRNLKNFHEGKVAVEHKGMDVSDPETIHARFIIATNEIMDLQFNEQDRKFSVPELCKIKLEKVLKKSEIKWLLEFPKLVQEQANFANWLKNNFDHQVAVPAWQGELFKQICYESRSEWFKQFLFMCENMQQFNLKNFQQATAGMRVGVEKIKSEIAKYEHETGIKIATIERTEKGAIFTSLVYQKTIAHKFEGFVELKD